jgi:hypothetical protein
MKMIIEIGTEAERERTLNVVIAFDDVSADENLAPSCAFLKRAARTAGRTFFPQVIETDDDLPYSFEAIHQRAFARTAVLDAILEHA